MKVMKQFKDLANGVCRLTSDVDAFVPEMSLPIKDILQQFAFIDNVRLADMAKRGYEFSNNDENDFDVEDFDRLDPAEKDEIAANAETIIARYNAWKAEQEKVVKDSPAPDVDEDVMP